MRGQTTTRIRGKVFYNNAPIEGVHIQNIDNQHYTTTDAEGSFSIEAQKGHTLKATFVGKKTLYRSLTQVDLQRLVTLKMTDVTITLDEVSVSERPKITTQNLGILQHTPKERTGVVLLQLANGNHFCFFNARITIRLAVVGVVPILVHTANEGCTSYGDERISYFHVVIDVLFTRPELLTLACLTSGVRVPVMNFSIYR